MTSAVVALYLQSRLNDERATDLLQTNNEQLRDTGHAQIQALMTKWSRNIKTASITITVVVVVTAAIIHTSSRSSQRFFDDMNVINAPYTAYQARNIQRDPVPELPAAFRSENEENILNFVHKKLSQEKLSVMEQKDALVALSNILNADMENADNTFDPIIGRIKELRDVPIRKVQVDLLSALSTVLKDEGMEGLLLEAQIRRGDLACKKRNEEIPVRTLRITTIRFLAIMISRKKFENSMAELTPTARWSYVLSMLLEYTVYLDLGELACKASQQDITLQERFFGPVYNNQSPGQKINMLLRVVESSSGDKPLIEIGCNEHKATRVDPETVHLQALKSHRINGSILARLEEQGLNTDTAFSIYLDAHATHKKFYQFS
ncbi:hypothetical protein BGZ54_008104 [Gamsiella multidivaricata]|nr:hypothetical protein BGZ54_008104 [Gamsiella multidivaricata]